MNIMIDYDSTFTRDVAMWERIIPIFQENHEVFLVTSRGKDTPIDHTEYFEHKEITIVYCEYLAKRDVCNSLGINIHIWIDDNPYYIDHGFITEDAPLELLKMIEKDYR